MMLTQSTLKKKIFFTLTICISVLCLFRTTTFSGEDPDPGRFAKHIQNFVRWDTKNYVPQNAILFVGSSSIVMWPSQDCFGNYQIVNRGFGGSHISDVNYYIDQTVLKYSPEIIVFYAGDNDIAGMKTPEQVFDDYKQFIKTVHEKFPQTQIIYVPIKPSIARWELWPEMNKTNLMIKEFTDNNSLLYYIDVATPMLGDDGKPKEALFLDDGLHLNNKGYELWTEILRPLLKSLDSKE